MFDQILRGAVCFCSVSPNIRSGLQIIFGFIFLHKQQFSIKIAFTIWVRAGRGRLAVTGCWDRLLKQMAPLPCADCFNKSVRAGRGAGRGRTSMTGRWDEIWNKWHGFLAPIVSKVSQSGPWGRVMDGRPWQDVGMDFWNKWHGFLTPIISEVRQSRQWGLRDGRPWRAPGMDFWNKRQEIFTPIVSEVSQSGPWWPWRASGIDFWNKRHGFLLPIVSEVRQKSRPWGRAVDRRSWRAAGMNFSELLVSLFHFNQISVSQSFFSN